MVGALLVGAATAGVMALVNSGGQDVRDVSAAGSQAAADLSDRDERPADRSADRTDQEPPRPPVEAPEPADEPDEAAAEPEPDATPTRSARDAVPAGLKRVGSAPDTERLRAYEKAISRLQAAVVRLAEAKDEAEAAAKRAEERAERLEEAKDEAVAAAKRAEERAERLAVAKRAAEKAAARAEAARQEAISRLQAAMKRLAEVKRAAKAAEERAENRPDAEQRAEAKREAEAAKRAEAKRKAEAAKRAEAKRKAEAAKRAEAKRKAEAAKRAEAKRKAEAAKRAEAKRKAEAAKAKKAAAKKKAQAAKRYVLPTSNYRITATFKQPGPYWSSGYHTGLDFATSSGTPVKAVRKGKIIEAGWAGAYGNRIKLQLSNGNVIYYCHLSEFTRTSGSVKTGEVIGKVGATGNVTGPHLHMEVLRDGVTGIDPYNWLKDKGLNP